MKIPLTTNGLCSPFGKIRTIGEPTRRLMLGLAESHTQLAVTLGATVVLHGRIVRKLEALYDEIVGAGHPQPTILPLDLASLAPGTYLLEMQVDGERIVRKVVKE